MFKTLAKNKVAGRNFNIIVILSLVNRIIRERRKNKKRDYLHSATELTKNLASNGRIITHTA